MCVCVCVCARARAQARVCVHIYIYIYIYAVLKHLATLPTSISHSLLLFLSPILSPLSLTTVYIPSFQALQGRPRLFLPSGFRLIVISGNRVGSILSTRPYQMSCFQVISSNIVSGTTIFSLIYSFAFLPRLEILADCLNASISVALIPLLSSSYKLQVPAP